MSVQLQSAGIALPADRAPARRGRRCAARPDEDAVTLAADAALAALAAAPAPPAALLLATTTPPYDEGGSAQVLAELVGLEANVFVAELSASARDGLAALRIADGLVASGGGPVLICAAHRRRADGDGDSGDGAVALLVGEEEGVAQLTPGLSHAEELRDRWRLPGDVSPREADTSFSEEFGASRVAALLAERALDAVPALSGAGAGEPPAVHLAGPSLRSAARVERALGGPGDAAGARTGVLGAAHCLLRVLTALDAPALVVSASGGMADALRVEPGDGAAELAGEVRSAAAGGDDVTAPMPAPKQEGFAPYASSPRAWRERGQDLALAGILSNGRILYPPPAGVVGERRRLARAGTVLTWTRDHVYPGADGVEMAVVTLDDQCRFYGQVASGESVALGDRVRLVPRRLHTGGGIVQYYWKVATCR